MASATDELLLVAAAKGDLAAVRAALEHGAGANARGEFGDTALNIAAQQDNREIVDYLLGCGANIETRGGADMTPLMNAAAGGYVEIVRLLLDRGARVNDDLLRIVQLKISAHEENVENGMVRPDAVDAWKGFLEFLIEARGQQ